MKKAATDKVFREKCFTPAKVASSISIHMMTARTTDASSPTTKAKVHNNRMTAVPFNHLKRFPNKKRNRPFNKNQMIPMCMPDKDNTWAMPATE